MKSITAEGSNVVDRRSKWGKTRAHNTLRRMQNFGISPGCAITCDFPSNDHVLFSALMKILHVEPRNTSKIFSICCNKTLNLLLVIDDNDANVNITASKVYAVISYHLFYDDQAAVKTILVFA